MINEYIKVLSLRYTLMRIPTRKHKDFVYGNENIYT